MEILIVSVFAVVIIFRSLLKYQGARQEKIKLDCDRREKAMRDFERARLNELFPPPPIVYSDDPALAEQERIEVEEEVPSWDDFSVTEKDALRLEAGKLFAAHVHAQYRMHLDHVNEYELVMRGWNPLLIVEVLGEPDLELAPSNEPPHPQNLRLRHYRMTKVERFEEEGALRLFEDWRRKLCQEYRKEQYADAIAAAKQIAFERYNDMLILDAEREQARKRISEVEQTLREKLTDLKPYARPT